MANGVNLYELMHEFWKENDYEPFPASATALFFFLLDRANSRHWKMPIRCPTSQISHALMVSEQTVLNSRNILYKRGIITYTKGHGNKVAPNYSIVTDPKNWAVLLGDSSGNTLVDCLKVGLEEDLTDGLNIYKMKDKKIKNQISTIYKTGEEKIFSLDELEKLFMSDTAWQADLISLLSTETQMNEENLKQLISYFFRQQKCSGRDRREEKECRTHFVNWIKKQTNQINNHYGINQQREPDKRRGSDVSAVAPRDYDGAF